MSDLPKRVRESLQISRLEGIPASVMLWVFDYYLPHLLLGEDHEPILPFLKRTRR